MLKAIDYYLQEAIAKEDVIDILRFVSTLENKLCLYGLESQLIHARDSNNWDEVDDVIQQLESLITKGKEGKKV